MKFSDTFMSQLSHSVLEYFLFERYTVEYIHAHGSHVFNVPFYYFRSKEKENVFFSRENLAFMGVFESLSPIEKNYIHIIVHGLKQREMHYRSFIKKYLPEYIFLFEEEDSEVLILNPEILPGYKLSIVLENLKKNPSDFWSLQAYTVFYYHNNDVHLGASFEKALEMDPGNPYILSRAGRYNASSLYKKNNKKEEYLHLWKKQVLEAIAFFRSDSFIPPYLFAWLWFTYLELSEYDEALIHFDDAISRNLAIHRPQSEPYIWKAFTLNKLWRYQESNEILTWVLEQKKLNDKKDFRFYKAYTETFYFLKNDEAFKKNLFLTIEKYVNISHFNVHIMWKDIQFTLEDTHIHLEGNLWNAFHSFLSYIWNKEGIEKVVHILGFFYQNSLFSQGILLSWLRGIDKLCYYYINL